MDKKKTINIDLTNANKDFQMASIQDADLLRIKCYATHEGKNANGTIFPRKILLSCYRTFIDKPVWLVPDLNLHPSDHGYDFKRQKFDDKKRINVGHIVDAYPVAVYGDGVIDECYEGYKQRANAGEYELRIICELVVYKMYFNDISETLKNLHNTEGLSFSMESLVDYIEGKNKERICTDIHFTGLAIVDEPAFAHSKSIAVAQKQKEEKNMDYEKAYKDLLEKYNALKAKVDGKEKEKKDKENASLKEELAGAKDSLAETKEELASVKTELAEAQSKIETLNTYKEKVEIAEKEALGKERAEKLAKLGVVKEATDLAALNKEDFADMLVEAAENFKPNTEVEVANNSIGTPFIKTGKQSQAEILKEFLGIE